MIQSRAHQDINKFYTMTIKYTTRAILEMLGRIPAVGGQEVEIVEGEGGVEDAARGENRRSKRVKVEENVKKEGWRWSR